MTYHIQIVGYTYKWKYSHLNKNITLPINGHISFNVVKISKVAE